MKELYDKLKSIYNDDGGNEMIDIIQYLGKEVIITNTEGKVFRGVAKYYNPPADSEEHLAEIVLETKSRAIIFTENEITSVEEKINSNRGR